MRFEDVLPAAHEAPPAVRAALRAIDPDAGLLYLSHGMYALGILRPRWRLADNGRQRRQTAEAMLARAPLGLPQMRIARLLMAGASVVDVVPAAAVEGSFVVEYFRMLDWAYRTRAEQEFAARLDEAEGVPALERAKRLMADFGSAEGRNAYAWAFRGRRTFAAN